MHRSFLLGLFAIAFAASACSDSDPGTNVAAVDSGDALDGATDTLSPIDTAPVEDTSAQPDSSSTDSEPASETGEDAPVSDADALSSETATTTCTSGTIENEPCGKCGTRSRLCEMGRWLDWGSCGEETGLCIPGETRDTACERCGTRKQTCTATCGWTVGACLDQKGCVAGTTETRYGLCLNPMSVQTRTCTETCSWTSWSECS